MASVIVAFFLSVAIIISAWFFLPRYESIPDGLASTLTAQTGQPLRPGVLITNQRTGAVEHCYWSSENYICVPVRVPAN